MQSKFNQRCDSSLFISVEQFGKEFRVKTCVVQQRNVEYSSKIVKTCQPEIILKVLLAKWENYQKRLAIKNTWFLALLVCQHGHCIECNALPVERSDNSTARCWLLPFILPVHQWYSKLPTIIFDQSRYLRGNDQFLTTVDESFRRYITE